MSKVHLRQQRQTIVIVIIFSFFLLFFPVLFYFMHFPIVTKIHRMSFGDYLGDLTTMIFVILFVLLIFEVLTRKEVRINENIGRRIQT